MKATTLRTFIPSIDFETSKQFYRDLGFPTLWESDDLSIQGTPPFTFFIQKNLCFG